MVRAWLGKRDNWKPRQEAQKGSTNGGLVIDDGVTVSASNELGETVALRFERDSPDAPYCPVALSESGPGDVLPAMYTYSELGEEDLTNDCIVGDFTIGALFTATGMCRASAHMLQSPPFGMVLETEISHVTRPLA